MTEPKTACEEGNPIAQIDGRVKRLMAASMDVLEISKEIESFLLGPHALSATGTDEIKKEPIGWYQEHNDNLDNIHRTLCYALDCLRAVKGTLL